MGKVIKKNDKWVFQQGNGEITAWFTHMEIKSSLIHRGSSGYRRVLYLLVSAGTLYLAALLAFIH